MEIRSGVILKDDSNIISEIKKHYTQEDAVVLVGVDLPDYLDISSLLAMQKRLHETQKLSGKKLRLIVRTNNEDVEKYVVCMFAFNPNIFVSVDWR